MPLCTKKWYRCWERWKNVTCIIAGFSLASVVFFFEEALTKPALGLFNQTKPIVVNFEPVVGGPPVLDPTATVPMDSHKPVEVESHTHEDNFNPLEAEASFATFPPVTQNAQTEVEQQASPIAAAPLREGMDEAAASQRTIFTQREDVDEAILEARRKSIKKEIKYEAVPSPCCRLCAQDAPTPCLKAKDSPMKERVPSKIRKMPPERSCQVVMRQETMCVYKISKKRHIDIRKAPPLFEPDYDHARTNMEDHARENPRQWPKHRGALTGIQLFYDDYLVDSASTNLIRRVVPGEKLGVVLQARDPPRDPPNTMGFSFYGNVIHNGSHFVMFYKSDVGVRRAVSVDGKKWRKVGSTTGISTRSFEGEMCVQFDSSLKKENGEYPYFAGIKCNLNPDPEVTDADFCFAYSNDGVKWHMGAKLYGRATDTYPCLYREGNHFMGIIRHDFGTSGGWREIRGISILNSSATVSRSILSMLKGTESKYPKGKESEMKEVSKWYLDSLGKNEWRRRAMYGLTRTRYAGLYIGMAHVYDFPYGHTLEGINPPFQTDIVRPYLVTSRDGYHFDHDWIRRQPLIPHGNKSTDFDQGMILPAADFVTALGFHWLYYAGWNMQHEVRKEFEAKIGLIRWRQNRLVEIVQDDSTHVGKIFTKPFLVPPGSTALYVIGSCKHGAIKVSVHGGDSKDDSSSALARSALQGCKDENTEHHANLEFVAGRSWNHADIKQGPVRLKLELSGGASLNGFRFQ